MTWIKSALYLLLLVLFSACTPSRTTTSDRGAPKSDLPKRSQTWYQEASDYSRIGEYTKAIDLYNRVLAVQEHMPSLLGRASSYGGLGEYDSKLNDLLLAESRMSEPSTALLFELAQTYYALGRYDESLEGYRKYLDESPTAQNSIKNAKKRIANLEFILEDLKSVEAINLVALPGHINTPYLEYLPSITADQRRVIFTRRIDGQEDLYLSDFINGQWTEAQAIDQINTRSNESGHCISADGGTIIFTRCDQMTGYGSCDLWTTRYIDSTWTVPINLGSVINTQSWEAQPSLSADGDYLIYSSTRPGGRGNRDLWISRADSTGRWGIPVNLGEEINTSGNESTPFIHPDGITLYYRSDALAGYGGYDLYLSRFTAEGWSTPENLGAPINTPGDEGSLVVDLSGRTAYYASETEKSATANRRGDIDLYTFDMPVHIRPQPVTFTRITVRDRDTDKILRDATVELYAYDSEVAFDVLTETITGSYLVCLPVGTDYGAVVSKDGYAADAHEFSLTEVRNELDPIIIDLYLQPVETYKPPSDPVRLETVRFATASYDLLPASYAELRQLASLLGKRTELKLEIRGHTDNVGDVESNRLLSEQRAEAVRDYLIAQGVDQSRLTANGYGETLPLAENDSPEGRAKNRRVEFAVKQ